MRMGFTAWLYLTLGLVLVLPAAIAQEHQGQYRSRVLLTPEGEWLKGADLSIEELEAQLGSIEETYARSSAGRHLARHYVERKEYDKAIAYYQKALTAEGLSDVANREMLREMAQVYFMKRAYGPAAQALQQGLALDLVADKDDYLLLARAYHELGRFVDVVATLDKMQKDGRPLSGAQMQQALALYYRAGAFVQSADLLTRLLQLQPDEPQHWHLLTSVYLQQNKKKQALDQLALAREKQVPFSTRDVLLLANLQAANSNPFGGAQTLQRAMSTNEVPGTAANYRRLFEFWLQAREPGKASEALKQAANLSGDTELYLYLAQLQMEQQDFEAMHTTMLAACADELPERFVGRANLLLGISQLKLGDEEGARRSLINATLIGGVNAQAGQWLDYMNAAPATDGEARRIEGICYGPKDARLTPADSLTDDKTLRPASAPLQDEGSIGINVKTVPATRIFYTTHTGPLAGLGEGLRSAVASMTLSLVKSGGVVRGPLHIVVSGELPGQDVNVDAQWGLPVGGAVSGSGRYRLRTLDPFKCVYQLADGSGQGLVHALTSLAEAARAGGHELTGESRFVVVGGASPGESALEVQLGIR